MPVDRLYVAKAAILEHQIDRLIRLDSLKRNFRQVVKQAYQFVYIDPLDHVVPGPKPQLFLGRNNLDNNVLHAQLLERGRPGRPIQHQVSVIYPGYHRRVL